MDGASRRGGSVSPSRSTGKSSPTLSARSFLSTAELKPSHNGHSEVEVLAERRTAADRERVEVLESELDGMVGIRSRLREVEELAQRSESFRGSLREELLMEPARAAPDINTELLKAREELQQKREAGTRLKLREAELLSTIGWLRMKPQLGRAVSAEVTDLEDVVQRELKLRDAWDEQRMASMEKEDEELRKASSVLSESAHETRRLRIQVEAAVEELRYCRLQESECLAAVEMPMPTSRIRAKLVRYSKDFQELHKAWSAAAMRSCEEGSIAASRRQCEQALKCGDLFLQHTELLEEASLAEQLRSNVGDGIHFEMQAMHILRAKMEMLRQSDVGKVDEEVLASQQHFSTELQEELVHELHDSIAMEMKNFQHHLSEGRLLADARSCDVEHKETSMQQIAHGLMGYTEEIGELSAELDRMKHSQNPADEHYEDILMFEEARVIETNCRRDREHLRRELWEAADCSKLPSKQYVPARGDNIDAKLKSLIEAYRPSVPFIRLTYGVYLFGTMKVTARIGVGGQLLFRVGSEYVSFEELIRQNGPAELEKCRGGTMC